MSSRLYEPPREGIDLHSALVHPRGRDNRYAQDSLPVPPRDEAIVRHTPAPILRRGCPAAHAPSLQAMDRAVRVLSGFAAWSGLHTIVRCHRLRSFPIDTTLLL